LSEPEVVALRREVWTIVLAWAVIAVTATLVAVAIRLAVPKLRPFPPQRWRATAWTGPLVTAAFLAFFLSPTVILPYIDGPRLARSLTGGDADDQLAGRLAAVAAETLAVPLQVAAWAGLLVVAGGSVRSRWNGRRFGGAYLAAVDAWLLLTPIVYFVSFAVTLLYRFCAGQRPDEHPIVQVLQQGPAAPAVVGLLFLEAVIVAPLREELFFRGIVQPWAAARPWRGDLTVWLAAVAGLIAHAPHGVRCTSLGDFLGDAAPFLFVCAVLPLYRLTDRWDLGGWLPVLDPALRRQAARAIIGTSLLFANFHANVWPTPIPLFVLSLGLGWLAFRTQGVAAPILLHMLFNAIVFAALALQPVN
jgi:membrane protease YdiL (CAAX protease family)